MSDLDTYASYDYAWKQLGWSVQNPGYTLSGDTYTDPGLPDDVSKVRVFGTFLEQHTGRTLEGVVAFRTSTILTHVTSGSQVMPGVRKIRFNREGFGLYLPATDDPQLTPEFQYECRLTVAGFTQEFSFDLPSTPDDVNILDLLPVP